MIDITRIEQVLLPDGVWHQVESGTFAIEEYVIAHETDSGWRMNFEANKWAAGDVGSKVALWKEDSKTVIAPFGSVRGFKTS
jgi:hypothetical protein